MFIGVMIACVISGVGSTCELEDSVWRYWTPPELVLSSNEECVQASKFALKEVIAPRVFDFLAEIPNYDHGKKYAFTFKCYDETEGAELKKKYPDLWAGVEDEQSPDKDHNVVPNKEPSVEDFLNNK